MEVSTKTPEAPESQNGVGTKETEPAMEITPADLTNLKIIFDWAVKAIGTDRKSLIELLSFEEVFTKKLKSLTKK